MKHITVKLTEDQARQLLELVWDKVQHYEHVTSDEYQTKTRIFKDFSFKAKVLIENKKKLGFYKRLESKLAKAKS